jgi:hypothetical protein
MEGYILVVFDGDKILYWSNVGYEEKREDASIFPSWENAHAQAFEEDLNEDEIIIGRVIIPKGDPDEQQTWEIVANDGTSGAHPMLDYLVINGDDDVRDVFDLYKEDEAGEHMKGMELLSYRRIN